MSELRGWQPCFALCVYACVVSMIEMMCFCVCLCFYGYSTFVCVYIKVHSAVVLHTFVTTVLHGFT